MLNDISSVFHNDIFEVAKESLSLREPPSTTHRDKQKVLTELLASVPLEERKSTHGERSQILKSIKVLGNRRVRADGAGAWTLKGKELFIRDFPTTHF